MPTNQSVTLVKGTVPAGTCFGSVEELYNTFVDLTTAYVNGAYSLFNYGDTEPSAADRDKPWIKTVGGFPDKTYIFADGYWLCKHPTPTGGSERRIWVGSLNDLKTYEGGTDTTVTSYSGPFWEEDTSLQAKFPVGVGTFGTGTVVNVNNTGGSEEVTLTAAQLPAHTHDFKLNGFNASQDSNSGNEYGFDGRSEQDLVTESTGGGEAHDNIPPYYGVYFIKRTGRIYYTA